ncbi:cytochrome c oxidase subunit I [Novosphingobium marinum]|uniref:Cytochrome c oxidase subunit I+III n=1 Tax=Novosphingobium marinum TaxID=1514948 RepID=A0A7Y9XZN1_9SPHN|nr:cbb3-type cytochrome c oxidase subunit I [Novosphingobium marinum]NYH96058.1 cytochrome c oxidase subunit I+III [Novosphingobium marinum]GGC32116.1 cytochrome c oxidase subunit I [Novosphingobium marinum]
MTAEERFEAFEKAKANLPDRAPRPEGELELLEKVWAKPRGWRVLTVVNNDYVGSWYVGAALLFFVLAGILALLIRLQLAMPLNEFMGQETYNQVFTMHGTIMMFLFAVPAVEAAGVLLLPQMFAARDLPFPRLSAFAFWAYLIGGLVFFTSLFWGVAPDGGWFMYPPHTSYVFSPDSNQDWWLLGIGFIEISAIAGAIEIVVGTLKTRSPGMTLDKLPVFGWAMLVFAAMIIVGFPAVILSTILLELERAFHWPFFIAGQGGDPLLWQHLFWFFGHPEVYIIFLPAAGLMSMIIPVVARTSLVGYRLVVFALIATGFIAFGVWAHHMFATGIPDISVSFFSAASMAVSIPAGVQVFAWIGTLMAAKKIEFNVPALFSIGAIVIFVIGGLTGVMVAMVPFDWQAHDSYFVVAHLHYVLIGGMVFPLFAAIYYWTPMVSVNALSEKRGKWAFWLMFAGMNLTFMIMHWTGMMGMPRRVYTYLPEQGLGTVNLIATVGAFVFAAGIAIVMLDLIQKFRFGEPPAGNVYGGGTLEWLPQGDYAARSMPVVDSLEPLWDHPELAEESDKGQWFLPDSPTGRRETIVTSPVYAVPQYMVTIPGPSEWHLFAAIGTAGFFLALTVKLLSLAAVFAILAVYSVWRWMWELEGEPGPDIAIGGGMKIPRYVSGPMNHGVWAAWVLVTVLGMIFACSIFAWFFLWGRQPGFWPPAGLLPPTTDGLLASGALYLASGFAVWRATASLPAKGESAVRYALWQGGALVLLAAAFAVELISRWHISPSANAYGAMVYLYSFLNGEVIAMLAIYAAFNIAAFWKGRMDRERRVGQECLQILWLFLVAQALIGFVIVGGFKVLA